MGIVCAEKIEASCWTGSFHSHMVQLVQDSQLLSRTPKEVFTSHSWSICSVLAFSQTLQVSEIKISIFPFRVLKSQGFF